MKKEEAISKLNVNSKLVSALVVDGASLFCAVMYMIGFVVTQKYEVNYEYLTRSIYAMFSFLMLGIIVWIYQDIKKYGTPFTKVIVNKLRAIGVIVMCVAVLPDWITQAVQLVQNVSEDYNSAITDIFFAPFTPKCIFILCVGVLILFIAEIFRYGVVLQEDSDSIA